MTRNNQDSRHLNQYFKYLKRHRFSLAVSVTCIPLIAATQIIEPLILKYAIDHVFLGDQPHHLKWVALLFTSVIIMTFTLRSLQSFLFQYIGQHTVTDIRNDLFDHISQLKMTYFDKTPQGVLTSRLTSDLESLNDSFATGVVTLIADILTVLGILIAMFYLSVKLTVVMLLITPPLFFFVNQCRKQLRVQFNTIRATIGQLNATIQEQLEGVSIIQQFNRQSLNEQQFDTLNQAYRRATISSVTYDALLYSVIESMASITLGFIIGYALGIAPSDAITIGLLVAFIDYIQKFFTPLKELSNKFAILQHALASLEKVFGLFNETDTITRTAISLPTATGRLSLKGVNFYYKRHPDKPILTDVSFDIHPHQTIAIVGPTGSGKSTLFNLLLGLYEGYSGSITMDNVELSTIDPISLRNHFVSIRQDTRLFNRSIAFNISLGNPAISESRIHEAIRLAHAQHIVDRTPDGIHATLNQFGQQLSAGEAQLIGFARALASDAPIILLDEATANIDSLSEKAIQHATATILDTKTVVVIAHRLSTIQHADRIIALKNGRIIESGTHDELMKQSGFYYNLYQMGVSKQGTV